MFTYPLSRQRFYIKYQGACIIKLKNNFKKIKGTNINSMLTFKTSFGTYLYTLLTKKIWEIIFEL